MSSNIVNRHGFTVMVHSLRLGVALGLCIVANAAKAGTIATWTFETTQPTSAGSFSPEVGAGVGTGSHAGASVYSSPAGNGSSHSFSSNTWAAGDYYQFSVSTSGLQALTVSWEQTSSSTGPRDYNLQYSTDGTSFTTFGNIYTVQVNGAPNTPWSAGGGEQSLYAYSVDLSTITALNNLPAAYVRMTMADSTSAGGGTVGTGGTDRVDNVTISAVAVPEPTSMVLCSLGGLALTAIAARRRRAR